MVRFGLNLMASNNKTVAALIGAGFMGSVHSRALRAAGIEIAGVLSSSSSASERAAKDLGIDKAYRSLDELLEDSKANLVHILTPNSTHGDLVSKALEAGKHVVCEKPLTPDSKQAVELSARAKQLGLVGAVPFVYRYHAMAREAKHRVASGQLGKIFGVRGSYLQDWLLDPEDFNWRVDAEYGGPSRAFADIGIHLCDLVEFVTGQRITRLVSTLLTAFSVRANRAVSTEDSAGVLAHLEGGAVVSLLVSQVAAGHKNALVLEVHGSSEAMSFEQENPEQLWVGKSTQSLLLMRDPNSLSAAAKRISSLPSGHPEGYLDAFISFVEDVDFAIQGDRSLDLPGFDDGARSAQLTEAVLKSAESGTWVNVS